MRVWSLIATVVLGSLTTSVVLAQAPAANAGAAATSQMAVAVVDVGYILKEHPTMKSEIEAIETQMKAADETMAAKRDSILKQMEQLREKYTEGTPEYEREEKAIAEQDTAFRLEIVKMRKEFDKSRANVLYKVYTDIQGLVKFVSDKMGIQVVIRVNGTRENLDPSKPDNVQLIMSQEVLHFNKQVDLTDWVLNGLKQRTASNGQNVSR